MTVVHYQRRPAGAQVSIERVFRSIRAALPADVNARAVVCPWSGKGLMTRLRNLLRARQVARDANAKGEAQVVHHVTGDVHYLALALPRRGLVLTIHDCAPLHRLRGLRRAVLRWCWYVLPVLRARVVTVISENTAAELRCWVPRRAWKKIRVVPNPVDPGFTAAPREWAGGCPVFLQVGAGWNKNLERVVEALEGTGARLSVVGPVDDQRQRRLAEGGVPIDFLGRVGDDRLVRAYQECDALLFASLFEGFGMPIIEAQATGRPVITSNRSSMPEVAGTGALLVDPEDVAAIRAAVLRLRDDADLRESLIEQGFRNIARYRPESVAAAYVDAYRDALADYARAS